jgi:hypothetical protein
MQQLKKKKQVQTEFMRQSNSPEARAIVHSLGSTVNNRPSYRISAFDIRLILEPSSGIPALISDKSLCS